MNLKRYFIPFLFKEEPEAQTVQEQRKVGLIVKNQTHRKLRVLYLIIPLLLLFSAGVASAKTPSIRLFAASFIKPKPIIQSSQILSTRVQAAIENLASQEIKAEQANSTLVSLTSTAVNTPSGNSIPIIQPLIDRLQETLSSNSSDRAKIKLRAIDRLIQQLQTLLEQDKSDKAALQAVKLIQDIGQRTGGIVPDPKAQIDREILKLQIEQYNRLQLILQKLEDTLPINSSLKVDDARVKYLVSGAQASLNSAPNLEAVHNIAIKEVGRIVGEDFSELKAIEILTDIEGGLNPQTKQKLAGLEKELAIAFEKRMLKLPQDVRNRKLQDYIKYSYGNPLRQTQSFERMKNFLTDRSMILGVNSLKELALQRLEDRVFEIKDQNTINDFLDTNFKSPSDLKILAEMKLDVLAGKDQARIARIAELEKDAQAKVVQNFGKVENLTAFFAGEASASADLLDVSGIIQLSNTLETAKDVSSDVKNAIKSIKQRTLQNFVANVAKNNFVTQPKPGYNPVSSNADVRLLLPAPQALPLLEAVKNELPDKDKGIITAAERANSQILANYLLLQVNDPVIFEQYQAFIVNNPQVKQLIQNYVGQSFFTSLNKKKQVLDKQSKEDEQKLYEKMQQIVQAIFVGGDSPRFAGGAGKSKLESQLPSDIQEAINKLKADLPNNNVPKLATPDGVKLPDVAKLPNDVEQAIVQAAKAQIKQDNLSKEVKLDLSVQAKDLGVSEPTILPGSLLYPVVELVRNIQLITTLDPIQRAETLLKQDNEKTLEAAKLVENSSSQEAIDLALSTLNSVKQDFDKLASHKDDLIKLAVEKPAEVDKLVTEIVQNGLARQTVFSAIESKVYGDEYVKVEEIRTEVLKEGVDTLLALTNNNVPELIQKLEQAVQSQQGSEVIKDIKAVDLLTEIARTQPEETQKLLTQAEGQIAKDLETKLLAMPKEERVQVVLDAVEAAPGNPVRQFEAADVLKNNFTKPETILLTESIKDKAVQDLEERISEITDATSRQKFVDAVIGDKPQDLKIAVEIETRVEVPISVEKPPVVQKIEEIKAEIEQNIIDTYKNKPAELAKTEFFQEAVKSADIADVATIQDLSSALSRSPEVIPEVVALVKQEETKIVNSFVESVSSQAEKALSTAPETIAQLVALKTETPPEVDAKIDLAIKAEVKLIEEHLTTQVNDSTTFQIYVAQITQDPVVAQTVAQVGGTQFTKEIEQKAQTIETAAAKEQTQLQTTVAAVEKEIFSAPVSNPSAVEQTLPAPVQAEIAQIKQEVPAEQIPQVTAPATVAVTPQQPAAPEPSTPTQAPAQPAATEAPAPAAVQTTPAAPAVEQPQAPAQPAAPAVPAALGVSTQRSWWQIIFGLFK